MITQNDMVLRGALTCMIARLGHAPTLQALGGEVGMSVEEVAASLQRLHADHALLLHPKGCKPWVVHPFALSPGSCWVQTPQHGYWANCLYCGFGIAAALRCDAVITTRLGGESETVRYAIQEAQLQPTEDVFHLSTPVAQWWDNVIHACASFQPFRSDNEIEAWCARHAMPRGATMSIPSLWAFARDWYGAYLAAPWRKRTAEEAKALFERHGLTSAFWAM